MFRLVLSLLRTRNFSYRQGRGLFMAGFYECSRQTFTRAQTDIVLACCFSPRCFWYLEANSNRHPHIVKRLWDLVVAGVQYRYYLQ